MQSTYSIRETERYHFQRNGQAQYQTPCESAIRARMTETKSTTESDVARLSELTLDYQNKLQFGVHALPIWEAREKKEKAKVAKAMMAVRAAQRELASVQAEKFNTQSEMLDSLVQLGGVQDAYDRFEVKAKKIELNVWLCHFIEKHKDVISRLN